MIYKVDRLGIDLKMPANPSPNSAAAVQELMGGKFGEMSTLMNYTMQSFNFRGRNKVRPFYDLIASIAGEEYGHIELVSYTINALLTGTTSRSDDNTATRLENGRDARNTYHFIATGQTAVVGDSMGNPWTGANVFSSGNLQLDLLHNFFLECGARANKLRVYDMVDDPVAKRTVGYLLVRGGLHVVAYAKAIEKLSNVPITKLLPIPKIENEKYPEAKEFMDMGLHRTLYTYSQDDFQEVAKIWTGHHPDDGSELIVEKGMPEGFPAPDFEDEPQLGAPEIDPDMLADLAKKMFS